MARIISIANQKGGVAKTTSALNVGATIAKTGKKVLLIDIDAQSSMTYITTNLVKIIQDEIPSMKDVILGDKEMDDVIINLNDISENLYLAPATLELSDAELTIVNATMREHILKRALKRMKTEFDYIIIDCPPARGLLTINALGASDYALVPVQADYLAYVGVNLLNNTILNVKEFVNPKLETLGYFITMKERTLHSNDVTKQSRIDFEPLGLENLGEINRSTAVKDATLAGNDIGSYDPKSKPSIQYKNLTKNILRKIEELEVGNNG
ncbi:ParA family protein (plasmid) [Carnobacterium maltaromaticum]|uniref:ParA family protein n=1 Tax=Carnobacterium maltaromaticum TaxID=2751 RepID=UPI00344D2A6A